MVGASWLTKMLRAADRLLASVVFGSIFIAPIAIETTSHGSSTTLTLPLAGPRARLMKSAHDVGVLSVSDF
ncbi:Uncharacterised protein [Mycobacteroides abscessus subsp. abscessus]|nr:Uncharacterised protein [Mycobacteroides abscessus subsp. abscessus]